MCFKLSSSTLCFSSVLLHSVLMLFLTSDCPSGLSTPLVGRLVHLLVPSPLGLRWFRGFLSWFPLRLVSWLVFWSVHWFAIHSIVSGSSSGWSSASFLLSLVSWLVLRLVLWLIHGLVLWSEPCFLPLLGLFLVQVVPCLVWVKLCSRLLTPETLWMSMSNTPSSTPCRASITLS